MLAAKTGNDLKAVVVLAQTGDTDVRCGCALGTDNRDQERDVIERICGEHSAVYAH